MNRRGLLNQPWLFCLSVVIHFSNYALFDCGCRHVGVPVTYILVLNATSHVSSNNAPFTLPFLDYGSTLGRAFWSFHVQSAPKSGYHNCCPIRMPNYVIPEYCVWTMVTNYRNQRLTGHAANVHEPIGRSNFIITYLFHTGDTS